MDLISDLYRAVDARDLPCMADVESSMLYFCSLVAKSHKVTLTGECADEILEDTHGFIRKNVLRPTIFRGLWIWNQENAFER